MIPTLYTVAEAAALCKCGASSIRQAIRRGELTPKFSRPYRFTQTELLRWLVTEHGAEGVDLCEAPSTPISSPRS